VNEKNGRDQANDPASEKLTNFFIGKKGKKSSGCAVTALGAVGAAALGAILTWKGIA
jgi:hypothetical protein